MNRLFKLHHGTIKKFSDRIIEEEKFVFEKRKNHWLGNGVYFFVDDFDQAALWAEFCRRKVSRKNAKTEVNLEELSRYVLEIDYDVEKSKYLNLDSKTDRIKLDNFIKDLKKKKVRIDALDNHEALCVIMDLYVAYFMIHATKYTFTSSKPDNNLSLVGLDNHGEQFCIYDSCTIDFSKVKQKEVV